MTAKAAMLGWTVLSVASAASLLSTSATADLACQARATVVSSSRVDFEALHAYESGSVAFLWNFGDGASSTQQNPSHTYALSSLYRVTLTVTDLGPPQQICRDTVEVAVGVIVERTCWGVASTDAGDWRDRVWGDAPLGVYFDCGGLNVPDPPPYTAVWSFGDGATSETCSSYHVYSPGTYWAVFWLLTGGNNYQCSTLRITALANPTPVHKSAWGRLKLKYR